jgi:hypothetical protein
MVSARPGADSRRQAGRSGRDSRGTTSRLGRFWGRVIGRQFGNVGHCQGQQHGPEVPSGQLPVPARTVVRNQPGRCQGAGIRAVLGLRSAAVGRCAQVRRDLVGRGERPFSIAPSP